MFGALLLQAQGMSSQRPTGPALSRLVTATLRPFWRLRRGMTLGAQGVVIDEADLMRGIEIVEQAIETECRERGL